MNVIVNKDWTLSFENESDETLNANDVMWHRLNVMFANAIRPTRHETVIAVFQDKEEDPDFISKEQLLLGQNGVVWSILIPPDIVKMAQPWYVQILVCLYDTTDKTKYVQKGTPFINFTVENGALLSDGSPVTVATVKALYDKTLEHAETAESAVSEVQELATNTVSTIQETAESAVSEVQTEKSNAVSTIQTKERNALVEINEGQLLAVNKVEVAESNALISIREKKSEAVNELQTKKDESLRSIQEVAGNASSGLVAEAKKVATAAQKAADEAKISSQQSAQHSLQASESKNAAQKAASVAERAANEAASEAARETMNSVGLILRGALGQPTFFIREGRLFVRIIKGSGNPYRIENGRLKMTIVKEVI